MEGFHGGQNVLLLGAGGQGQAVDVDILLRDAGGQRSFLDAAGHGHAILGFGLDAPLVNGKADHGRAVLFAQRQDLFQHLRLAVHRVDDGLAVVDPQTPLQCLGVGRIQLQGQTDHALQRFDHLFHQRGLVHAGGTHVDVEDLRPGFHLTDGLFEDVVHVIFPQGLLEPLFAGGVDPLAHHRDAVHIDAAHRRADDRLHGVVGAAGLAAGKDTVQQLDELRRGAAAAARREQVQLPVRLHLHPIELRGDVVAGAVGTGQTRVGLDEDREAAGHGLSQPLRHREDLLGAQRAVDADGIRPQTPRSGGEALHRTAGEGAAPRLKAHAGQNGQGAVLLGRQQSRFQLVQVGKRFKEDEVSPSRHTGPDDAAILGHSVLKGQRAVGLQQLPQRADVQRRQCAVGGARPLAVGNARRNNLFQRVGAARQLVRRRAEGVGVDDAAARCGIFCVDALDERRVGDVQLLGAGSQFQARSLQHGAHAAIQQDGIGPVKQFIRLHR